MCQGHLAVERTTGKHGSTMTGNQARNISIQWQECGGSSETSLDAEEDPFPL